MAGPFSSDFMFLKKEHIRLSASALLAGETFATKGYLPFAGTQWPLEGVIKRQSCTKQLLYNWPADWSGESSAANTIYFAPFSCSMH